MIKFTIITLFQEAIEPYLKSSMMEKAVRKGLAEFDFVNLREFGLGPHRSVDDTPYGGGDGMLLRCEPVFNAIESVKAKDPSAKVIIPTPVGEVWNQKMAKEMAEGRLEYIFLRDGVASARRPEVVRVPRGGRYGRSAPHSSVVTSGRPIKHYLDVF